MHTAPPVKATIIALVLSVASHSNAAVHFTGLSEPLEKNARALMPLAVAPCDMPRWRVERLLRDSDRNLAKALEAMGYYRFELKKAISFANVECWSANIDVTLGAPVLLKKVDVVINGDANDDAWVMLRLQDQGPKAGAVLNHGEYESFKQLLRATLQTRGYFAAETTRSVVTVDDTLSTADLEITIESGPQFHFGRVEFSDGVLKRKLLEGYAEFSNGDPYDGAAVSKLHESLSGSGYFGSVSVQADPTDDGSYEVPVVVTLTPGMRRVYTTGIGFATDIGVQGRLGYTNRRVNDSGHQFDNRIFLSEVDSQITTAYRWPRGNPRAEWVDIFGGLQQKNTDTSESDKATLGLRVARNRTEKWLETPYINLSGEDSTVADETEKSRLLILGINWESTIGREISRIRSGHRLSLDVRGSHDGLISDATFAQVTGSTKWAFPAGEFGRFLARADVGTTYSEDFVELPASVTFFAGGDNSVRGYGYETIGPLDNDGNVVGGRHLAAFSIEYDRLIAKKWSIAAFVDTGSAFNKLNEMAMKTGVGLGIRWYSPLGPVRIDFAHPLDDPGRDFRLHISLGPDL